MTDGTWLGLPRAKRLSLCQGGLLRWQKARDYRIGFISRVTKMSKARKLLSPEVTEAQRLPPPPNSARYQSSCILPRVSASHSSRYQSSCLPLNIFPRVPRPPRAAAADEDVIFFFSASELLSSVDSLTFAPQCSCHRTIPLCSLSVGSLPSFSCLRTTLCRGAHAGRRLRTCQTVILQVLANAYIVACDELNILERPSISLGLTQSVETLDIRRLFFPEASRTFARRASCRFVVFQSLHAIVSRATAV